LLAACCLGFAGFSSPGQPAAVEDAGLLVTSSIGATSSILFVVDPASRTLAAYEAVPGAAEGSGLKLLGARKIEQDLKLLRYQDLSEFSYNELKERYESGESPDRGKKGGG
jgi:hypothetical protein